MRNVKALSLMAALVLGSSVAGTASAQVQYFVSGPATTWMIQDQVPQNITLWNTGASYCNNGELQFSSTSSFPIDFNMLLAVIATSKATGIPVIVHYTSSSSVCTITSFGLNPQ
jgi:hypothetical protein